MVSININPTDDDICIYSTLLFVIEHLSKLDIVTLPLSLINNYGLML